MKAERCIITRVKTDVFRPCLAEIDTNRGERYPIFRPELVSQAQVMLHRRVVLDIDRSQKTGRQFIAAIHQMADDIADWLP